MFQERFRDSVLKRGIQDAARNGHRPSRITLGTYREMARSLATLSIKWGLPAMEWTPENLSKDGSHYHLPDAERIDIYEHLKESISNSWKDTGHEPIVALCKESKVIRGRVGLLHDKCNCG